jgi:pyruvate,water dikinase
MEPIRPIESLSATDRPSAGGKAVQLGAMARAGLRVPAAHVLPTTAYAEFVDRTGLRGRIVLELNRKSREQMRWEEMWDASLRIRNMFASAPWPSSLRAVVKPVLQESYGEEPVAVRSSAPEEDTGRASFAGVHASFINVRGVASILEHIKLVWASLFSDSALLYAGELGIDVLRSSMAVCVQKLVHGECSGVTFTRSPTDESRGVIEAVHGLNQGLVDGTIPPDRWVLDRETGRVIRHEPAERERRLVAAGAKVIVEHLPAGLADRPPLDPSLVVRVWNLAEEIEGRFETPQDVEWTIAGDELFVLQARPVTTLRATDVDPGRAWYLSLRRSFETLERLRARVEGEHLPAMAREADDLARQDLSKLTDAELDAEADRRRAIYEKWHGTYWEEMIPLAHGVRLFGELYNGSMKPEDPYEFVRLLEGESLRGVKRNDRLLSLAARLEAGAAEARGENEDELDPALRRELDNLLTEFGGVFDPSSERSSDWAKLLSRLAHGIHQPGQHRREENRALEKRYLNRFRGEERERAQGILELARSSYRLRDDDNLYLGRIDAQLGVAEAEQRRRGRSPAARPERPRPSEELALTAGRLQPRPADVEGRDEANLQPRQLLGQPAGPGVARGRARVVMSRQDLFDFEQDDVLVCDAVDPNMTFVVPLARAVVERRGGMLIHGAIIAREYGLPCVTGIPEASAQIRTGDEITVDGYMGIVTVHAFEQRQK